MSKGDAMKRKVCMVVQEHYPMDVRVRKEAQALLARGHKVWVIALRGAHESRHEVVKGVEVYRIGFSKQRGSVLRYLFEYGSFFVAAALKLNVLDFKERFDVIHVNTLPDFLVFAALVQRAIGRRIVLDMHEIMPEFFMSKFKVGENHPVVRLLRLQERASLRFADRVITVNDPIKAVFQRRAIPGKHIEVVMNTVSASTVGGVVKRPHRGINCVYHGTVTDMYGLDIAIEGFAKARRAQQDLIFHIYGDGPGLPALKALVRDLRLDKEAVVFHGAVPYDQMMDALSEMDLGILAIRKDVFLNLSFSNKLAEYVYLKIPVVSSDLDTVKYYFDDNCLLFFRAGDADDLSEKIRYAHDNVVAMRVKAEKAYATAQPFDWDAMTKRYVSVIEDDRVPNSMCEELI